MGAIIRRGSGWFWVIDEKASNKPNIKMRIVTVADTDDTLFLADRCSGIIPRKSKDDLAIFFLDAAYSSLQIFESFLDKFGNSKRERKLPWSSFEKSWKIERGILLKALDILKRDQRELENIMKTVATKEELKIHLGIS